ncbi:PAS domain-containing protein [Ideonella sp.]|uniref:sensor histidine kinase n=1 Tax=Ideonella sp. TaxID=1929293 RepID=UPI002CABB8E0|nr:PAS domain-containing protein [Ramlibacter sp.]
MRSGAPNQADVDAVAAACWQAATEPMAVVDEHGKLLQVNLALAQALDRPVEALAGQALADWLAQPGQSLDPLLAMPGGAALPLAVPALPLRGPSGPVLTGPLQAGPWAIREGGWMRCLSWPGGSAAADWAVLRQSEQHFRLFTQATGDAIWLSRPGERRTLYVSPAFWRMWGQECRPDLADCHAVWLAGIHAEDRDQVAADFVAAATTGQYETEYRVLRPDGSMIWVRDHAYPVRDATGQMTHMAGLIEDITAAHEAQQQQRQRLAAEAQLLRLVATAPGVLMTYRRAADGMVSVQLANPKVAEAYGLSAGTSAGAHDPRDVIVPEDRERLRQSMEASAQSMARCREEFRVRHPQRGLLWVEMHVTPVTEADGAIAWHGFLHEVTARKQVEEQVLRTNAELEARVAERTAELEARHREMEAFSYSVSHDLKAPLRGIDGYSRLLLTDHADKLDEEGRFFVDTIRKATVHMGQLIDDLLAYSRVERSRPTLSSIDPAAVINRLVGEYQRELDQGQVTLEQDLSCTRATGEREGLTMAVRNLLDNALKFTQGQAERRIRLRCAEHEGRCRIEVRDNGSGFDMRYAERIFEIFQRLHRAEDYPGTGVGLAIVRKAVERMQGRVWAESVTGQGAHFFIELPL